jgi:hypothetical protein
MPTGQAPDSFNVLILYDQFASVGRAMAAYLHISRELGDEFVTELSVWRIDVAASPEHAARAEDEIRTAELVILAVCGSQTCPVELQRWTEGAVGGGCLPKQALIVLGEEDKEPAQSVGTWNSVLRSAAAQSKLNVFLWAPVAPAD